MTEDSADTVNSAPEPAASGVPDVASASPGTKGMPPWLPRAMFMALAGLILTYIAWRLLGQLRGLLIMLVVALFLSFALEPAVNYLSGRGMRRGLATALVMFGGFLALAAFLALMGQVLFTQVRDFIDELPVYLVDIEEFANDRFGADLEFDALIADLTAEDAQVQEVVTNLAGSALDITISAVGVLFQLFTVALFVFYMVADGPRFRRTLLQFLPPDRQERVITGWEIAIKKTGGYIYSRALLALVSAVATTIFLLILDVPFALALGVWTGVISQFIPTVGTYIGGALPVLIALSEDPVDAVLVLVFIIVYQQIENYFFAPKITAQTMDLHPAVAFGTVIAGASLLGPVGAVLALPAAAVVQAVGSTYIERHEVIDTHMTRDHGVAPREDPAPSAQES